jgi:hypothetical protein
MIRGYSSYTYRCTIRGDRIDASRKQIQDAITGADIKALGVLDGVTALQPPSTDKLVFRLTQLRSEIFECPSPSRASVEDHLRNGPLHECGLSFANASNHAQAADSAARKAIQLLDEAFRRRMEVFLNPAVRERLDHVSLSLPSQGSWLVKLPTSCGSILSKLSRKACSCESLTSTSSHRREASKMAI